MKCLFVLLLAVAAHGAVIDRLARSVALEAPNILGLTLHNGPYLDVTWTKVVSPDNSDPVLGYLVKVWEMPNKIVYEYQMVDGKKTLVQQTVPAVLDINVVPDGVPEVIEVKGADTTVASVKNIKYNVQYHIRVQAYTKTKKGPLSNASGIKLEE